MTFRRPPQKDESNSTDAWLMSYADMITLLLCFFVIFVATSEPKQEMLAAATKGFHQQFGTLKLDSPYDGVFRELQGIIISHDADQNISVEKTKRGVAIEISTFRSFMPNSADISPAQRPVIEAIAGALRKANLDDYVLDIEGHTDNRTLDETQFASHWELGALRASHVARILIAEGLPAERMRVISLADTQPAVPNSDAMGRPISENQDINQRIVIKVERLH